MSPKVVRAVKLTFSDMVEIQNFEHFKFCPKFWLKILNNANECYTVNPRLTNFQSNKTPQ